MNEIKLLGNTPVYIRVYANNVTTNSGSTSSIDDIAAVKSNNSFTFSMKIADKYLEAPLLLHEQELISPLVHIEKTIFSMGTNSEFVANVEALIKNNATGEELEFKAYFKKPKGKANTYNVIYQIDKNGEPEWLLEISYWTGGEFIRGKGNREYVLFVKDKEEDFIMKNPYVSGVGVKYVSKNTIESILVFYSSRISDTTSLYEIPREMAGIPVEFEEADFYLQFPPVDAISEKKIKAVIEPNQTGTMGLYVKDDDQNSYWLTAAHVLFKDQDLIDQAGRGVLSVNLFCDNNKIQLIPNITIGAESKGYFGFIWWNWRNWYYLDCGIVKFDKNSDIDIDTSSPYNIVRNSDKLQGGTVSKNGAASGKTTGKILEDSLTFKHTHTLPNGLTISYSFKYQLRIKGHNSITFSKKGDSGSIVLKQDSRIVVGMVIAGTIEGASNSYTVATPIYQIFNALNIKILQ